MSSPSPKPQQAQKSKAPQSSDTLYESRKKLYVRAVTGVFANWRWALVWITQILFYGLPWLSWNDRQAVLFHLAERKFYIFGTVFWPQDVFFLAILLIISAYALFFFTAIAGRLWCGYACPQTVYTEIFMWIEQKIEGDHIRRQKLDQAPMSANKLFRRSAKFLVWGLVALWTGFTFVAYFSPTSELLEAARTFSFGPWELFWILFYGAFTFLFAGVLREQVCKYMCPYARFQAVMFDPDTLVITYDEARGEPRGTRKKGVDPRSVSKGDCIDCGICVQVCPTGIDIRDGLQYECIGCAACIDACDSIMDKLGYARGLIRYGSEHEMQGGRRHLLRPRLLGYAAALLLMIGAFAWALQARSLVSLDVAKDRGMFRENAAGQIENVYRLKLINKTQQPQRYHLGLVPGQPFRLNGPNDLSLAAGEILEVPVSVVLEREPLGRSPAPVSFEVINLRDGSERLEAGSTFIAPSGR